VSRRVEGNRERTNLVTEVSTVQADLVLVVSEGSVESSEFSELIRFVMVLSFGSGCSLFVEKKKGGIEVSSGTGRERRKK